MTEVQQLARFVVGADYSQLSVEAVEQLKIRVLDTVGVAIGALDAEPMVAIRALTEWLGGNDASTLIGGGSSAPDRVAFYNTALSRYLDFMDSYLAVGETNHPSDNLGAVLAAAESRNAGGRDFLTAFPDMRVRNTNRVIGEDSVAGEVEFTGTNTGPLTIGGMEIPATGKSVVGRGAYFARVRNGKIVEFSAHPDAAGMMMQLGLMQR